MTAGEALALSDYVLAVLYSEWSEETWAAWWIVGGEAGFVESLGAEYRDRQLPDYQIETLAKIRELLRAEVPRG